MAHMYRKYMRLLDKWPVDKTRSEDFGQHLREQIKIAFSKGEGSRLQDQELCEKNYQSLDKIASNYYAQKYPHNFKKTSTGLTPELCALALSKEGQKALESGKVGLGFFDRLKESVKGIINKNQEQ